MRLFKHKGAKVTKKSIGALRASLSLRDLCAFVLNPAFSHTALRATHKRPSKINVAPITEPMKSRNILKSVPKMLV